MCLAVVIERTARERHRDRRGGPFDRQKGAMEAMMWREVDIDFGLFNCRVTSSRVKLEGRLTVLQVGYTRHQLTRYPATGMEWYNSWLVDASQH